MLNEKSKIEKSMYSMLCILYKEYMYIYVHTQIYLLIFKKMKYELLKESGYSMAEERDKVRNAFILFYRFKKLFIYMRPKMEQFEVNKDN